MAQKDSLFKLIKSLERGEKRAFKIYATKYDKGKSNAHIRLFDVIEQQTYYDEQLIKEKLEEDPLIKQLAVIKTQLFKLILRSLHTYNVAQHPIFKINEQIEFAIVLNQKGLIKDAYNIIQKARKFAAEAEQYEQLLLILSTERLVVRNMLSAQAYYDYLPGLETERERILAILANQRTFNQLLDEMYQLYRTYGTPRSALAKEKYEEFLTHPFLQDEKKALSSRALLSFFNMQMLYYQAMGENKKGYEQVQKQATILEQNYFLQLVHPDWYLSILNNALAISTNLGFYKDFQQSLEKLITFKRKVTHLDRYFSLRIFEIEYSSRLAYFIKTKQYVKGLVLDSGINKNIEKYKHTGLSTDRIVRLSFGMALIYYYQENWIQAHSWLNKILDLEKETVAINVIGYAKILDIILHYEQQNYQLLEYQLVKVKRYLTKHKLLLEEEKMFLFYFRKLVKRRNTSDRKAIFLTFFNDFTSYQKANEQSVITTHLKLHLWITSKITAKSFAECTVNE